jgi:hypothetical protein
MNEYPVELFWDRIVGRGIQYTVPLKTLHADSTKWETGSV